MKPARNEFFHELVLCTRLLKRRFEIEAQPHGLTMPQWRVLGQLNAEDGISQVTLAGLIEADPMTVSGLIERLEAKNLVSREPNPEDSRSKIVRLTEKARAMVSDMHALSDEVSREAFAGISAADRRTALKVLNRMSQNLSAERIAHKEELA